MKNKKELFLELYNKEECKERLKEIKEDILYIMKDFKISNNPYRFERDLKERDDKIKDLLYLYSLYYNFIKKGE